MLIKKACKSNKKSKIYHHKHITFAEKLVRSGCFLMKYNFYHVFCVLKHEKYQYIFEKTEFENIEKSMAKLSLKK